VPQITIRGDNNLINFASGEQVKVTSGGMADSAARPTRHVQWPRQILDAIRIKAMETGRSGDELCEIAGRTLGRVVLNLEKLSARELALVYEAICTSDRKA